MPPSGAAAGAAATPTGLLEPLRKPSYEFDGSDYLRWSRKIRMALGVANILKPLEEASAAAAHNNHQAEDTRLYYHIAVNLNGVAADLAQRIPEGHGRALWDLLAKTFHRRNKETLITELLSIQGSTYSSVSDLVRAMQCKIAEIVRAGETDIKPTEANAFRHLCRQLPPNYQHIAHSATKASRTWDELCDELLDFANTIDMSTTSRAPTSADHQALAARGSHPRGGDSQCSGSKGGPGKGGRGRFKGTCNLCHNEGHKAFECNNAKRALEMMAKSKQQQQHHHHTRGSAAHIAMASTGSMSAAGPEAYDDEDVATATDYSCLVMAGEEASNTALMATEAAVPDIIEFAVDSGATACIVGSPHLVTALQPTTSIVRMADGRSTQARGCGNVRLAVTTATGASVHLTLGDTLVIDGALNLLSVSRFTAVPGNKAVLTNDDPHLRLHSGVKLQLVRRNGLYILRATSAVATAALAESTPVEPETAPSISSTPTNDQVSTDWALEDNVTLTPLEIHERAGHLNQRDLVRVGLLKPGQTLPHCSACHIAKSTRRSVPKQAAERQHQPGEMVWTDIAGPFEVAGINGNAKYAVGFLDDHSRYVNLYLMREKSEVPEMLKKYLAFLRCHGIPVGNGKTTLQADSEAVYKSQQFIDICEREGVLLRFSPPYLHSASGKIERLWRTLTGCANAMRMAAKLSKGYWPYALMHSVTIHNWSPRSGINGDIPVTRLLKQQPNYTRLQPFGAAAYVHDSAPTRQKLDPRARRGIFVGIAHNCPAALIYMFDTRRVVESYHVRFGPIGAFPVPGEGENESKAAAVPENLRLHPAPGTGEATTPAAPAAPPAQPAWPAQGTQSAPRASTRLAEKKRGQNEPLPATTTPAVVGETTSTSKDLIHALSIHATPRDPRNVAEALRSEESAQWQSAIEDECNSLIQHGTFTIIPRSQVPRGEKVLHSMFLFKRKQGPDGHTKFKARLVCNGSQQQGVQHDELYAPTVHLVTVRVLIALVAQKKMHLEALDICTAFLHAKLDRPQYMMIPQGFPRAMLADDHEDAVMSISGSLYGLRTAPRQFHDELAAWLEGLGLRRSLSDPCLFIKQLSATESLFVTCWVDDLLIASSSAAAVHGFKADLAKRFKTKPLGRPTRCLGMNFHFGAEGITIEQQHYVDDLLEQHGLSNCNPTGTPLSPVTQLLPASADDELLDHAGAAEFRAITGSLLYLACVSRPDLSVTTHQLSRFVSRPTRSHAAAAKTALRYLRGAKVGLTYHRGNSDGIANKLVGYADASWACDPTTSRSLSGYVFLLNGTAVSWRCKGQSVVALSTAESEYSSLTEAVREAHFLRGLLGEMGERQDHPTTIFEDNMAAQILANQPQTSMRTRHVALRFHFVREAIRDGVVEVKHCSSQQNLADSFTKILPKPHHCLLRSLICG